MKEVTELQKRLKALLPLHSTLILSWWDERVNMPEKSAPYHAETSAFLSAEYHKRFLAIDDDKLLTELHEAYEHGELQGDDAALVRETWRDYSEAVKLPEAFVKEFAEVTSHSEHAWEKARAENDFARFKPHLEKIVKLSRKKASYLSSGDAYDALLDTFEPDMTSAELTKTFTELKEVLVPLVERIAKAKNKKLKAYAAPFPIETQHVFLEFLNEKIGFDMKAGHLGKSVHPFTIAAHPLDVRITVRYDEKNPWEAIGTNLHEGGHALYDQGLPLEHIGTTLCRPLSLGVHESQSRFWENMVGKNRRSWRYLFPHLKKRFPRALAGYDVESFYRRINQVQPGLIRTESDEVTYNLHIILRFEIERALIKGEIEVDDLPELWSAKMREYLGLRVPSDKLGVLQDVHWSTGSFGYFPTYTLGNLYSAQLYDAIRHDMKDFDTKLTKGQFLFVRDWLREKIHCHGRRYHASELMTRATGSPLAVAPFAKYLTDKYMELYDL